MAVGKVQKRVKTEKWDYLDGEMCFSLWVQLGALSRIRKYLVNHEIVNPQTGKPPTEAGIRVAARRWQLAHLPEAREVLIQDAINNQNDPAFYENDETWYAWNLAQLTGISKEIVSVVIAEIIAARDEEWLLELLKQQNIELPEGIL